MAREHLRRMVDVVELGHGGVAVLQHLDIELRSDRLRLLGREALHELIHELAPRPEIVVRCRAHVGQAGHGALEGVRMQVRHAGQHRTMQPLGAVRRAVRFHGGDVAAVDADEHVARPSRGQKRVAREVFFHAVIIARCMTPSG